MALFALGAVAANAYPLTETSQSVVITSIHLPVALWLALIAPLRYLIVCPAITRQWERAWRDRELPLPANVGPRP